MLLAYPATPRPAPPRVIVVDGDRRVQQSLSELLQLTGSVDVVGRAGDPRSALRMVEQERPDVVVLDPRIPDLAAGVALASSIRLGWPDVRIVLTGWEANGERPELAAAASAYVSKTAAPEIFTAAVVNACGAEPAG